MLKYIIKRILIFIPTVIAISLLTFIISLNAPGDPVEQMLSSKSGEGQSASLLANEKAYLTKRKELGLDLPIFYFSLGNAAQSDTLHRIAKRSHKKNLDRIIDKYGNWQQISDYYHSVRDMELVAFDVQKDSLTASPLIGIKDKINELYIVHKDSEIKRAFDKIEKEAAKAPALAGVTGALQKVKQNYTKVVNEPTTWKKYIPSLQFYGFKNQYHRWFFGDKPLFGNGDGNWTSAGFIRGDFGISYKDQRPVAEALWDALKITMMISFLSIILTYIFAIPLGVSSATSKGTLKDQVITTFLFILYALPSFWIATLAIVFLCGGDYFDWFPPVYRPDLSGGFFSDLKQWTYHLILPLTCWTYGTLAYLSRQMRGGMLNILGQDFIRTARSKGLNENTIVWKHAMRNSLLPVITIFASVFPLMISGSIVLEIIFSIPGMGKMIIEAISGRNYPIVFSVTMFSAILTLVGYLVSDILYAMVDPRISYGGGKK